MGDFDVVEEGAVSRDRAQTGQAAVRETAAIARDDAAQTRSRDLHDDIVRVADSLELSTATTGKLVTLFQEDQFWRTQFTKSKRRFIMFLAVVSIVLFMVGLVAVILLSRVEDAVRESKRGSDLVLTLVDPNSPANQALEAIQVREEAAAVQARDEIIAVVRQASQDILVLVDRNQTLATDLAQSESTRRQATEDNTRRIQELEAVINELAIRLSALQQPVIVGAPPTTLSPPSTGLCALLGELGALSLIGCE